MRNRERHVRSRRLVWLRCSGGRPAMVVCCEARQARMWRNDYLKKGWTTVEITEAA